MSGTARTLEVPMRLTRFVLKGQADLHEQLEAAWHEEAIRPFGLYAYEKETKPKVEQDVAQQKQGKVLGGE